MPNTKSNNLKKTTSNAKEDICISLIGPAGCGKSALLVKYLTKRFIGEYDPCYEGCWTKIENIDNTDLNIQLMDTFDEERRNLDKYFKWSDLLVLVYSITNKQSFLKMRDYLEQIFELVKKSEEANEKKFLKIILLGNKIDMERHRQVSKQEIESLVRKYSPKRSSPVKFTDSTNTIKNEGGSACASADAGTGTARTSTAPLMSEFINIMYVESTACEEYEPVKAMFSRIIKEYKREKELYVAATGGVSSTTTTTTSSSSSNEQQLTTPQPPPPAPPLPMTSTGRLNSIISIKGMTTRDRALSTHALAAAPPQPPPPPPLPPPPPPPLPPWMVQRGKSPKSTLSRTIMKEISPAAMSIINANLSSLQQQQQQSPSSSHSQIGPTHMQHMQQTGPITTTLLAASSSTLGLVGSTTALISTVTNNMSSSSLNRIDRIFADTAATETGGGGESTTNSESGGGTPPSTSIFSNVVAPSSASIKKNSSKFPFLTKILNKNN